MLRRIRFLLVGFSVAFVILSLTVTGCGLQDLLGNKNKKAATGSQQKPAIAVSLSPEDPNRALIMQGIQDMAQKGNIEIKDVAAGGQDKQGQSSQGSEQESSSSSSKDNDQGGKSSGKSPLEGAKVLILQGGDQNITQLAQQKKIPVVALGSLPGGVTPAGVVLPDPGKTGELMAQTLVSKLSEGQVVIMQGDPNDSSSQEILAGNKLVLSRYPKIVVNVISSPAGSEAVAMQNLAGFLRQNPGKVNGVLALTERLAAQASEVLKQAQPEKKVVLVGGQVNMQSLQRMAVDSQQGDVDTNPYLLGVSAYQWAQKIVKKEQLDINESITGDHGEIPAKFIPVKAVTPDNLSVVQKSYAKAVTMAQQAVAQKQAASSSGGKDGNQGSSKSAADQGGQSGSEGNKSQGQAPANIPAGVNKVTERVHTEITREYLDAQGKVIGTEKNANDQVRTIPPEMLVKEQTKQQGAPQDQKSGGPSDQKEGKSGPNGEERK